MNKLRRFSLLVALSALVACSQAYEVDLGGTSVDADVGDAHMADAGDLSDTVDAVTIPPSTGQGIACGNSHTCVVWGDRSVRCWGANDHGQLGRGTMSERGGAHTEPQPVSGLENVLELSAGVRHTCALLASGGVRCWGGGEKGQLGQGEFVSSAVPVAVLSADNVVQISSGSWHACALLADGTVQCWGWNRAGELGDRTRMVQARPVDVRGLDDVEKVASGLDFSCALTGEGRVLCWGGATRADADGRPQESLVPTMIAGVGDVVDIDAGASLVCALRRDGTTRCWGAGSPGAIGFSIPQEIENLSPATSIRVGAISCGLRDGRIECWDALARIHRRARSVPGIGGVAEVGVGFQHACVRLYDGTFRCWGYNASGQASAGGCCAEGICGIPEGASCGANSTCSEGWCSACGGEGQACCDPANHQACRDETPLCTYETSSTCERCGGLGERCCRDGQRCGDEGAVCHAGRCALPGEAGGPCLAGRRCASGCCSGDFFQAQCVDVGSLCAGPAGAAPRVCGADASCGGCGGVGEECCEPSFESSRIQAYCSAPDVACESELGLCLAD